MKSSLIACLLSLTHFTTGIPINQRQRAYNRDIPQPLQSILDNTHGSSAYSYPTDLTRDIVPKPIHSHNDYWRDVPFFSALSVGCESVEADVWLYNDTLYVGHEILALTPERTFDSLYIQPILNVLNRQNPKGLIAQTSIKNGVFDTDSSQTLYLFVDIKTEGASTWQAVVEALEPLRSAGYLTSVNGTTMTSGAVTVIGTGNIPLDQVAGVKERDYFYDANAGLLDSTQSEITALISPIASAEFSRYFGEIKGTKFNDTQLATLREQIAAAKSKGIGVRYWETPAFPISKRNAVWETLIEEGVMLINADDLRSAAGFAAPAGW